VRPGSPAPRSRAGTRIELRLLCRSASSWGSWWSLCWFSRTSLDTLLLRVVDPVEQTAATVDEAVGGVSPPLGQIATEVRRRSPTLPEPPWELVRRDYAVADVLRTR
jgi:hypothetical protein